MDDAITELSERLYSSLIDFVAMLPRIVIAIIVLIVFFYLASTARRYIRAGVSKLTPSKQLNNLTATIGRALVIIAGFALALYIAGLGGVVVAMLAGAGIVGLALGFAFQDIAANFISGILLAIRRPFGAGELVETNDFLGLVVETNLRSTHLQTLQGQIVVIPNQDVLNNPVVNYSRLGRRRIDLECGVAYGDDLKKAKKIALNMINSLTYLSEDQPVDFYFNEFGDSSINFVVRFWVEFGKQTDFLEAQSTAITRLKTAFDDADITIPFPIRTLDFGVVGGEKLSDVLPQSFYKENGDAASEEDTPDSTTMPSSADEL